MRRNASRGFTLPEVLVASVVLGAALIISVRLTGALRDQHREAQRRQCALAEAENCLERLTATPWEQLTKDRAAEYRLSDSAVQQLPKGELEIDIAADAADPDVKRVTVEIHWQSTLGHSLPPLRLEAWVYRRGESESPAGN